MLTRQRKPNRLRQYDYSRGGYYFATVCTKERGEWFGEIENGQMVLNDAGKMIENYWNKLLQQISNIELD